MEGQGEVELVTSGVGSFEVTWAARSQDKSSKTSPEELIAAAHSTCFSMALSNMLAEAGTPPTSIRTDARVTLRPVDGTPTITKIELTTVGVVPGIDEVTFQQQATEAKRGCPVSRALASVPEITLEASLSG